MTTLTHSMPEVNGIATTPLVQSDTVTQSTLTLINEANSPPVGTYVEHDSSVSGNASI